MAAVAVGACQPCALLNGRLSRLTFSRFVTTGRVSLAWDPLLLRSGLEFSTSTVNRKDVKRGLAPWRASAGDEMGEEKFTEHVDAEKGSLSKFSENLKQSISSAVKPAVALFLAGMLLLQPVDGAMAASSGGRMGGRAFKSAPAPSRSFSGGGGSGGRAYSAPPIYGSPYGYGAPFGFSPFTPFFGGGYYGGGLFLGPSIGFGGGGFFLFAFMAYVTFRAIAGFIRDRFDDRDDFDD